jgi:hypothetical protein
VAASSAGAGRGSQFEVRLKLSERQGAGKPAVLAALP